MEKRAIRRHQQDVAKTRHLRIVWRSGSWNWSGRPYNVVEDGEPFGRWRKPWQQISRCTMNGEPKHWQYDFNIRPSRTRQAQLLRDIQRGMEPELVRRWPDYRRPHVYYW